MTLDFNSLKLSKVVLIMAVVMAAALFAPGAQAQLPDLIVKVSDTTTDPGTQNTVISIFLTNYNDVVAGYNVWLQLDRPDIMLFQTDIDTSIDTTRWLCLDWEGPLCNDSIHVTGDTIFWRCDAYQSEVCTDSTMVPADSSWDFFHLAEWDFFYVDTNEVQIGNIDTVGTLCGGWEWVDARSLGGVGTDLNVAGIADLPAPPSTPGINPQQGGVLIKLLADVLNIPDTMQDRTVNVMIQTSLLSHFNFSDPDGSSIGILQVERPDTNYWKCTLWAGDVCMNWQRVSMPPADSMNIGLDTVSVIDFDNVWLDNGSVTVRGSKCGDVDASGLWPPDISDLLYLVDYMFTQGPVPNPEWVADFQCDGIIDISDLIYLVDFMFTQGPEPCDNAGCGN